jgi:hypothetical protein
VRCLIGCACITTTTDNGRYGHAASGAVAGGQAWELPRASINGAKARSLRLRSRIVRLLRGRGRRSIVRGSYS